MLIPLPLSTISATRFSYHVYIAECGHKKGLPEGSPYGE